LPFKDSKQARRVAHQGWAKEPNRKARTQPGRDGALAKLEREVDPDGVMTPEDRRKAAENARQAHLLLIAEKSVASRARKKAERAGDG
jgi:hypothetical protein